MPDSDKTTEAVTTAVVTGAGSGIGEAIAHRLARAGHHVVVCDINADAAEATADAICTAGLRATPRTVDVASDVAMADLMSGLAANGTTIDIVVNNAGVSSVGTVETTSAAELRRVLAVNVEGVANGMRAAIPHMLENGGGVILNMASIASLIGIKDRFAYSASKGAVLTMTYSVAIDYADKNIRCNCICPARIHTPFVDGYLRENYPGHEQEVFDKLSAYQPIGRMGAPDEVAGLAAFLCGPDAAFITGAAYRLDGGVTVMPGFE